MAAKQKKILVVDDDEDIVKLIKIRLQAKGFEVITALDGDTGLFMAKKHNPDLVVADLTMPGMNGWQMSLKLKQDDKYKKIPVIILSALIDKEGLPGDAEVGDFYLAKPFDADKLMAKINELLPEGK